MCVCECMCVYVYVYVCMCVVEVFECNADMRVHFQNDVMYVYVYEY